MNSASKSNCQAVIMAGGSGTRFWPYSTPEKPKQFLDLTGEGSMLQLTVRRLEGLVAMEDIWIITGEKFRDLVMEQCPEIPPAQVVGEPMPRDTAAAIALAGGLVGTKAPDSIMCVLPADHVIKDIDGFQLTMQGALKCAESGEFVTVGIKPTYPAEVYGYLHRADALEEESAYRLGSFVEKPSREKAEAYLATGEYFWNAGMFVWQTSLLLKEMDKYLQEHGAMARRVGSLIEGASWSQEAIECFSALPKISIDYGLMEKLDKIAMVEASFDWNDVGGWLALEDLVGKDGDENTLLGFNVLHDSKNNIIITQNDSRPTLVCGVSDSIIVNANAGTLVCHRKNIEQIREHVQKIFNS